MAFTQPIPKPIYVMFMLCYCESLTTTTRGEDVFNSLNKFFMEKQLEWDKLIGVYTDGAPAMLGLRSGFQAHIKKIVPLHYSPLCIGSENTSSYSLKCFLLSCENGQSYHQLQIV